MELQDRVSNFCHTKKRDECYGRYYSVLDTYFIYYMFIAIIL